MANNPRAAVDQALFTVLQNAYPWAYSSMHFQGWGSFSDKQPAMFLRRIRERIVSPKGPMLLKYTYEYECWIYLQTQKDDPNINPYFGTTNTQLASDNFQRPNENPLAGNWTPEANDPANNWYPNQLLSDAVYGTGGVEGNSVSYYNAVPAPANQYAQVAVGNLSSSGSNAAEVGVALRCGAGTETDYELTVYVDQTGWHWQIERSDGGVNLDVLSQGTLATGAKTGDVVLGSIFGSELSLYLNGILLGKATDSKYSSGQFGLITVPSDASNLTASVTSWAGGSTTLGSVGIDPIVDAVDSALAASPVSGKNTLGGLVNECYLDGMVMIADGTDDGQAVIRIPIVTTTGI